MDNVAILCAPVLMWIFFPQRYLFMFSYDGNTIDLSFALTTITMQLVIGIFFDIGSHALLEYKVLH